MANGQLFGPGRKVAAAIFQARNFTTLAKPVTITETP